MIWCFLHNRVEESDSSSGVLLRSVENVIIADLNLGNCVMSRPSLVPELAPPAVFIFPALSILILLLLALALKPFCIFTSYSFRFYLVVSHVDLEENWCVVVDETVHLNAGVVDLI